MADRNVAVRLTADINGYVSAMGQASQATRGVAKEAQAAGSKASSSFGSGLASAAKVGASAVTATAAAVTALGVSALKAGISYNALQQSSRAALTTILGGSQAANEQMDKLDEFARSSPFGKQIFIQAQQQLLGFGLEAKKVVPALDAIQNAVAAVGGSDGDISNVTDALAKMLGSGKLAGDTLNRLGMYGIDAASIIGESMNMTGAQIREMASKPGGIPADQVWDVLIRGLDKKFGGAAENVKKTWVGATDRIKGAWRDIGSALAEPFAAHKGGGMAIEWVNKFADMLRAIEKQVKPLVDAIMPKMSGSFASITPLLEKATAAIKGMDPAKIASGMERVARVAPGIAAVSASILAMGGNTLGLEKIGLRLNPVVAGIVALVAASPEGRAAVLDLLKAFEPLVPVVAGLAGALAGSLTVGIEAVAAAVQALTPGVSLLASGVGLLADGFSALPGPVQMIVGALAGARVAMALLNTEMGVKMTTPLRDMVRGLGDSTSSLRGNIGAWGDLTRELREANPALGGVQARIEALSTSNGILGRMSDSFMNAAVMAKRFPNAAGAAAAAMTGLKGAASGLLSALGGPWGIAISAATLGIMAWANANAEARQRVQELTDAVRADSGVVGANTRERVKNRLESEGLLQDAEKLGLSLRDVTDAAMGNTEAFARVTAAMDGNADAQTTYIYSGQGAVAIHGKLAGSADRLRAALSGTNEEVNEAKAAADRLAAADRELTDETDALGIAARISGVGHDLLAAGIAAVGWASKDGKGDVDGMGTSITGMGDAAKDAKDQLKQLKDMVDSFAGGERALRAEDRRVRDAIRQAKEAAAEKGGADPKALAARDKAATNLARAQAALAEKRAKGGKGSTLAAEQRVQKAQEGLAAANKRVAETMKDATKAQDEYQAKLDALAEAGESRIKTQATEGKSLEEIVRGYNQTRDALIALATARRGGGKDAEKAAEKEVNSIFMTKRELDVLIATYGKLNPEAVTEVKTKGGDKAIAEIKAIKGTIDGVPRVVDIKVGITSPGMQAAIATITSTLGKLPGPFGVLGMVGHLTRRADGGPIPGHSPHPRADNIPVLATAGEWVIRNAAVAKAEAAKPGGLAHLNRTGEWPRFADGGQVGYPTARAPMSAMSSMSIDYARFGQAVADRMPPMVTVHSGKDAKQAATEAISEYLWRRDG